MPRYVGEPVDVRAGLLSKGKRLGDKSVALSEDGRNQERAIEFVGGKAKM